MISMMTCQTSCFNLSFHVLLQSTLSHCNAKCNDGVVIMILSWDTLSPLLPQWLSKHRPGREKMIIFQSLLSTIQRQDSSRDKVGPGGHKTAHGMCPQSYSACWMQMNAKRILSHKDEGTKTAAGQRLGSNNEVLQWSASSEDICVYQHSIVDREFNRNVLDDHFMVIIWRQSETFWNIDFVFPWPLLKSCYVFQYCFSRHCC